MEPWAQANQQFLESISASPRGLAQEDAAKRLNENGPNLIGRQKSSGTWPLLIRQFASPIVLILIAAAIVSFALSDPTDGIIILIIVFISGILSFFQEKGAADAVAKLLESIELTTKVIRDGQEHEIPFDEVVVGDLVSLQAGDGVPADCRLWEERDLYVSQAALTGESFPVEKSPGVVASDAVIAERTNCLFMGSHVVSGTGLALVYATGSQTEIGRLGSRLEERRVPSDFEDGVRRFGLFLMRVTVVLVVVIFAVNLALSRPVVESFLFSLAIAVGLTPQLLPAIISVNLARGAREMAKHKVIVKQLTSIESLGSMSILCSDKTGTLTTGVVKVQSTVDALGQPSDHVLLFAQVNALFQTAYGNPIDQAIREGAGNLSDWTKLDEVPYDFHRKRVTILAEKQGETWLITKGAVNTILDLCATAKGAAIEAAKPQIDALYQEYSQQGLRTLGIAAKRIEAKTLESSMEQDLEFVGFLSLADPPKAGIESVVAKLKVLGVQLKMISGDNALVAAHVGRSVGLRATDVLSGRDIAALSSSELAERVKTCDIFAEIEPAQKEQIILALKRAGFSVGYMGDGINDAPALRAADVGISVESAVDVAKESADIVLMEQDLAVLEAGVMQGRQTFANTLKYVFMATSANFGNMFSMAGASLLLPFLPLLPKQILVTNLLTDIPELTIAGDRVDSDWALRPRRWDLDFVRRFMLTFGLVSSIFDWATFGVLLLILRANPDQFRTGWFIESVCSAALIVLVVRTRHPFFQSRPSRALTLATLGAVAVAVLLPYSPIAPPLGMVPLSWTYLAAIAILIALYILAAEAAKFVFYRRMA